MVLGVAEDAKYMTGHSLLLCVSSALDAAEQARRAVA